MTGAHSRRCSCRGTPSGALARWKRSPRAQLFSAAASRLSSREPIFRSTGATAGSDDMALRLKERLHRGGLPVHESRKYLRTLAQRVRRRPREIEVGCELDGTDELFVGVSEGS